MEKKTIKEVIEIINQGVLRQALEQKDISAEVIDFVVYAVREQLKAGQQ